MKILVINSGSSSLKYQVFDMETETSLCRGIVERIGIDGSRILHRKGEDEVSEEVPVKNHEEALTLVIKYLTHPEHGVVKDLQEIDGVGHRLVHGREKFIDSALITDEMLEVAKEMSELAPLHNPPNILGIEATMKLLPGKPQVAVFDTSFHQTMPQKAYLYGLPWEYYKKYSARKYGFHGTSHKYVALEGAKFVGKPIEELKIITLHLGNGSSIAAIKEGKSIDTSMGLTPLEGLPMGTRVGDVDPGTLIYIARKEKMTFDELDKVLNKKSGFLGLSTVTSDMKDLEDMYFQGDERAIRTIDVFCYRILKYVGSYYFALGGLDLLIFTGGIGENAFLVREKVLKDLEFLGIKVDYELNKKVIRQKDIVELTTSPEPFRVLVVPTNEELMIARDTVRIIKESKSH